MDALKTGGSSWRWPLAFGGVVLLLLGVLAALGQDSFAPPPSLSDMRAYRISIMSDDQIRNLKSQAEVESSRRRAGYESEKLKAAQESGDRASKCADEIYRLRHGAECAGPLLPFASYESMLAPAAETLFEDALIGPCNSARTRAEARQWKCMPPA